MNLEGGHHDNVRNQFAQRILTYEHAANWMLSPDLIRAQRDVIGEAPTGGNLCLDLCCGTGIVGRNLLDLGWNVKGLDLTPEMGWVASQYYPVKVGSVEEIPFADASFDLAVLRQSFMLVDGARTLKEIHRILKPGGRFVLIQSTSFSDADDEVYSQVQWARHINQLTYYRTVDLENTLSAHGFTVTGCKQLRVRESVDHWLNSAPELAAELREKIRGLIRGAPDAYKKARQVEGENAELFEDWNWVLLTGTK
jgi:ubiquinone/menaquinone biosynthesis C-methylase UbiE